MAAASSSARFVIQQTSGACVRSASNSAVVAHRCFSTNAHPLHTRLIPEAISRTRLAQTTGFFRHVSSSSSRKSKDADQEKDRWSRHRSQYNYDPFSLLPEAKHYTYPLVTAQELATSRTKVTGPGGRPREVRMLARDFIHDSLYNPDYGYFTKQAVLLPDPPTASEAQETQAEAFREVAGQLYKEEMGLLRPANPGFDFNSIKNESEFMRLVEERYQLFEEQISILVQERKDTLTAKAKSQEFEQSLGKERRERAAKRASASTKASRAAAEYSAAGLEEAQRRGRAMRQSEGVQESDVQAMAAKQVWHTPTQIFQPYYAHAIARYLVAEYKLHNYPYDDLVVYELGAGSGALARGILDYLEQNEPEIYTRTRYKIVEISARLAAEQRRKLGGHVERSEVVNQDILTWNRGVVQEPCFVIALEVFDNLAHDVVRFSTKDLTPYQAVVSIDDTGDMHELWEPLSDALIQQYLSIIGSSLSPLSASSGVLRLLPDRLRRAVATHAPFFPNLTPPMFVPTNALRLLQQLKRNFPHHRLIMSDFDSLPDSLQGINAPVVQTRFNGSMIPVTTYLVLQGYFDIFFPTNFDHLRNVYRYIFNRHPTPGIRQHFFSSSHLFSSPLHSSTTNTDRNLKILSHSDFLLRYAHTHALQLKDGTNPLLSWYANASWFLS